MHKSFFTVLAFFSLISGQDITVSKDSIQVYNSPLSSYADEVIFTSHSSAPIHLDSAFAQIAELDTVGYGRPWAQLAWSTTLPVDQQFVWGMVGIAPNNYRLVKDVFYPGTTEPLVFSGNGATSQMFYLEIGFCFQCELYPKYPRYFRGTLRLFFSNGQVIELRIKSNDLRTSVRHRDFVVRKDNLHNGNVRYLANGRRVGVGAKTLLRNNPAIRTYFPDKGR